MTWWGWMILGAVLFGAELFAVDAQFYVVFLGVSVIRISPFFADFHYLLRHHETTSAPAVV